MNRRGFLKSLAAAAMTVAARAYSTTEPAALPAQDVPRTIRTRLPPVKWRKIDVEYIESMNREFAELVFYGDWREHVSVDCKPFVSTVARPDGEPIAKRRGFEVVDV